MIMMSSSMLQQFLWAVFVALLLWQPCNAAQIGVGGDGTWSLQNGLSYYKAWANGVDLQVGDTIEFVYDAETYDVRSVPSANALTTCDFSDSTILGNTGDTVVALNEATTYYFGSNEDGTGIYCVLGLAFQAVVTNVTTPRSPPKSPGFVTPPSPPQGTSSGNPFVVPPVETGGKDPHASSGSDTNLPVVIGGTTGGVVGLGAFAGLVYYFRDIFMCFQRMHRPQPQTLQQYPSQPPAYTHPGPHAGFEYRFRYNSGPNVADGSKFRPILPAAGGGSVTWACRY